MSVKVEFISDGEIVSVTIPYQYSDLTIKAEHITCEALAIKHGNRYIKILESDRTKNSGQKVFF